jgi:BirA family transcriptional regulator, biotin operon repressor / biotin---[acetyl-CoA-carboxylase] ligase
MPTGRLTKRLSQRTYRRPREDAPLGPREWYEEIDSTQDRALELARAGAVPGTRVVARHQRRGRGRLDHRWASPPGSLYLSIVLPFPAKHGTLLPLAVGAELAGDLAHRWGVHPRLKWPNDLLVADAAGRMRKLSGILMDQLPAAPVAVAGIGVNVRVPPGGHPPEVARRTTSLEEWVVPCPSVDEVESVVAAAAMRAAERLDSPAGVEASRRRCEELLYGAGRRATVDGVLAGTIAALGPEGELLLDVDGERMTIRAGDLRVEGP